MAMSRSFKNGSDEVREQASDFCCICANNARIQPASYFCFECGVFGRYLCGTCFRNHNLFVSNHDVTHIGSQSNSRIEEKDKTLQKLGREVKKLKTDNKMMEIELNKARAERDERDCMVQNMERLLEKLNSENTVVMSKIKEPCSENEKFKEERIKTANDIKKLRSEKFALEGNFENYRKNMEKLNRDNQKKLDDLTEDKEKEVSSLNNKLSEIIKKRVDLKTRSNPANTETLLVKRTEELNESEKECKKREEECKKREEKCKKRKEECKYLRKEIEEKNKTLQVLDGEVKKLETDYKMMEIELNKARAGRDERQSVVQNMERQLEKLNSENTNLMSKIRELSTENAKLKEERSNDIKKLTSEKFALESNIEKYKKNMEKLYRDNQKKFNDLIEDNEKEVRSLNNKLSEVIKERDDLKTRFSKLDGAKLTDQNADIADLSDPNRAMKVSERFGQLYDDEWTDAFEELKKKKMDGKDAIKLLLHILQDCHAFCNNLKEAQIDSLNNVLLHPSQDITKFANEHRKNVGGLKERPRLSSKDEKAVRNLRRQIGVSNTCIEEVKQVFVLETKSWVDRGCDKKQLEVCKPYLEKCAEVCWLMVLHDPPLYMKMDASEGDKMDPDWYTVYSTSGDKIRYLVWPPLYNEAGGVLISKGVAECVKIIKKTKH